jgi:phage tail sheath protein FI
MANYKTPGVYIEEITKFPPSVAQVETAIPAFIGYTEKAKNEVEDDLLLKPTRISSLLEYVDFFGGPQKELNLKVTLEQQFDARTGELTKEAVTAEFDRSIGKGPSKHLMYYSLQLYFANGGGPCWIVSVGKYLTDFGTPITDAQPFVDGLDALGKEDEPTLILFPEAQSMDKGSYIGAYSAAVAQCVDLKDRFTIIDFYDDGRTIDTTPEFNAIQTEFRSRLPFTVDEAKYCACYFPNLRSTFNYAYDESGVSITHVGGTAEHNGKKMDKLPGIFRSKAKGAIDGFSIFLPPSGAVAGIYARVDNLRGVWKAPANVGVLSVDGVTAKVTDALQSTFNVDAETGKSINVIRFFVGQGIKVWGARTLAGNDNEWRYVPVRRFFNMVEESVKKATNQFVFEPNDANTWVRVKGMIENFLIQQWRAGALQGIKQEHAFYVSIGLHETMTALDILEGRMIVEIGMAVVRPAEFIILRFSHKMAES